MIKLMTKMINVIFFGEMVNTRFKNKLKFFNLSTRIRHSMAPVKCNMNEPFLIKIFIDIRQPQY